MSREVMFHVFASQNELGCLCDEAVYQNDIALRLEAAGLGPVAKEVPVSVSLRDFTKTYCLDLVVQESFISELKTSITLSKEHDSQLLNYLLLLETPHGKLINLRPSAIRIPHRQCRGVGSRSPVVRPHNRPLAAADPALQVTGRNLRGTARRFERFS